MKKSNSQGEGVALRHRLYDYRAHFLMRLRNRGCALANVRDLDADLEDYRAIFARQTGRDFSNAKVFEVGFGARPLRMFWMHSAGIDSWGVDLDRPILKGSLAELLAVGRTNGLQRLFKSFVRHFMFDASEWRVYDRVLKDRGLRGLVIRPERFIVGDVASFPVPEGFPDAIDFVYSEDVFEHVPPDSLDRGLARVRELLTPDGCAIFRPHIFTAINGGHLTEWYGGTLKDPNAQRERESEPWEHLRKNRFQANTYLNKLRLGEYREMISRYFDIVEERQPDTELSRPYLTPEVRAELADYTEEELLAIKVLFICRPKAAPAAG